MYDTLILNGETTTCTCAAKNDTLEDRAWWGHHYDSCAITVAEKAYLAEFGPPLPVGSRPGLH